jgi:putative ABC transport system permease protein
MRFYFNMAYKNLIRHWRQTLSATLAVGMGFFTTVIIDGFTSQSRALMSSEYRQRLMFGDINVEKDGLWSPQGRSEPSNYQINENEQQVLKEKLESSSEVEAWSKFIRISGLINTGKISAIFWGVGYDIETGYKIRSDIWKWNTLYGLPLEKSDPESVVLAQTLAKNIGCEPDPEVRVERSLKGYRAENRPFKCQNSQLQLTYTTRTGQISAVDLNVTGIIDAGYKDLDSRFLLMPLEKAQSLAHTKDVTYLSILLKDPDRVSQMINDLQEFSNEKNLKLKITNWQKHEVSGGTYRKAKSMLDTYTGLVVTILICVALLSVLNTLSKIITERSREIGTWRSLGYTSRQVQFIFAAESMVLGLFGCAMGAVLALSFSLFNNSLNIYYHAGLFVEPVPNVVAINPKVYLLTAAVLIFVCYAVSFWATRDVLKKKISENLISV